jgi:hypothetical protein
MQRARQGQHLAEQQRRAVDRRELIDALRLAVSKAEVEKRAQQWPEFETSKREIRALLDRLSQPP